MTELLPEGKYLATATPNDEGNYGKLATTDSGLEQVLVYFQIDEGDHKGEHLAWFGYFSEKTEDRTMQSLRYMGLKGDELYDVYTQDLTQQVQLVVAHEEYNGKVRAKIQWVNQLGAGFIKLKKPMDANEAKRFSARMKGKLRSIPEVGGATAPSNGETQPAPEAGPGNPPPAWSDKDGPPPITDDDIPF